jgi:hypothetical protein
MMLNNNFIDLSTLFVVLVYIRNLMQSKAMKPIKIPELISKTISPDS